jgi:hypothetical protein
MESLRSEADSQRQWRYYDETYMHASDAIAQEINSAALSTLPGSFARTGNRKSGSHAQDSPETQA